MNLNYAIFRSEPIYTINDLAQIGLHNKREKQAYNSNPDIKVLPKEIKLGQVDNTIRYKLEIIINEVLKIFNNVDYEVEYVNIKNKSYAHLYLSSIMSNSDIFELNNLSDNMNFCFNIISSSEKIHRQNRNSKIEINMVDNN